MYLFCNSRIHIITLYSGHACVYYVSMLRCWHLVWILVRTDHPCLGVGCHSWYQSHMNIIRHGRPYFWKPMVRIRFNACIRIIVVLTGGKLTGIYFLYLLSAIYISITMHLRQGKMVSILVPGDVYSSPIASRWSLLAAVPIMRQGLTSIVRRVTTAYPGRVETWECLVATFTRREYVLMTYAALSTQC
jgi:hypothetical protein